MIRLYIIEDNLSIIISGFKRLFFPSRDGIEVTGASETIEDAIQNANPSTFDLFILDLWLENRMPVKNIRTLKEHFPDKRIIVFTSEVSPAWKRKMYEEGATAYLTKNADRIELKKVIEMAMKGQSFFNINLDEENRKELDEQTGEPKPSLTPMQHEIVVMLSNGMNHKTVSLELMISPSFVQKNLKLLRKTYKVKNNVELISHLINHGLI